MSKFVKVYYPAPDGQFSNKFHKTSFKIFPGTHFGMFDKFEGLEPAHWCLAVGRGLRQRQLVFDIDIKNRPKAPFSAVQPEWVAPVIKHFKLDPAYCGINFTGFGVHIYAFFDQDIDLRAEPWIQILHHRANIELNKVGFELDKKLLVPNQCLRVAGTKYLKFKNGQTIGPFPTKIIKKPKGEASWEKYRNQFLLIVPKESALQVPAPKDLIHIYKERLDWDSITGRKDPEKGCRFLKDMYRNQQDVDYQEWLAQLSLTSKYNDNEAESLEYARQYSLKSDKFDAVNFVKKFKEVRYKINPYTCRRIKGLWKKGNILGGCRDCPHYKLNMPLRIRQYPSQDTGFRLQGKMGPKNIDYVSLCDYLNKEKNILTESDETFYIYNTQKYWSPIAYSQIASLYKDLIKPQITPAELSGWEKFLKHHSIFNMEQELRKTKDKLFLKNCILDTKTMKISEAEDLKYKNFYRLDFDYDSTQTSPLYEKLLDIAFKGKPDERDFFLQYMAVSLFTRSFNDKAMILVGDGSNGKSSLVDGIAGLFKREDKVFMPFSVGQLKKDETHHHYLRKAKIAYLSDADGRVISKDRNLFKRLISGETFSYRMKYARSLVYYKVRASLVIGMNEIPVISEDTQGIRRRFVFLSFNNKVWLPDIHPDYENQIKKERAGILNILLEALKKWRENKKFPEISKKVLDTAVFIGDIKSAFWKTVVNVTGNEFDIATSDQVYLKFKQYCQDEGTAAQYICSRRLLTEWILAKRVAVDNRITKTWHKNNVSFRGIKLNELSKTQSYSGQVPF